ncbi:hypothetical protein ACQ4PT_063308 [Festuca glaucescens]
MPSSSTASSSRNSGRQPRNRRTGSCVMLEWAASVGGTVVGRTRSLTEEDLEELKGCLDLGFGFAYNEIPRLELCYSMTRRFLKQQRAPGHLVLEPAAAPIPD